MRLLSRLLGAPAPNTVDDPALKTSAKIGLLDATLSAAGLVQDASVDPSSTVGKIIAGAGGCLSGLDAARPAASSATVGSIYYATDSRRVYYQATASKWTVIGVGDERQLFGPFTSTSYMASDASATAGPPGQAGFSVAVNFYTEATAATTEMLVGYINGATSKGWAIFQSANTQAWVILGGTTTNTAMIPATIGVGAHTIAFAYKADGSAVHCSIDGGAVQAVAFTGAYVQPDVACYFSLSKFAGGADDAVHQEIAWFSTWNAELSDVNLVALSSTPTNYRPPNITTAPDCQWQASWYSEGAMVHNVPNTAGADYVLKVAGGMPMRKRAR